MNRVPLSLVRLRNLLVRDPNLLIIEDTKMPVRSMSGLYKTLDDESVVELDIDIIWDKFIRLNPQLKREFSDPMFDIVNGVELFNRTSIVYDGDITSSTYNSYPALFIAVLLDPNRVNELVEVRYSLDDKTYYKMVKNNQVIVIPPNIDRLYSTRKTTGIIITI